MSTGDETARTDTAAASEIISVETEAILQGGKAILSTNPIMSAVPVDSACIDRLEPSMDPAIAAAAPNFMNAETAGVEFDLYVGAEPEADHKVMMSARVKNVRKADSMETTVNESLTSPEKKMRRAEGELLGENRAGSLSETAATPRPSNWDTMTKSQKSMWRRRNERNK